MTKISKETLGLMLGFIGIVIFGGTVPATRIAVESFDPSFLTTARAAVAGILSLVVLIALRRPWPSSRQLWLMLLCAMMVVAGFPGFLAFSLKTVPASHGGVVLGILPLTTALAAAGLLGERPSIRFWFSACLGTIVVLAFAFYQSGGQITASDLLLLAAAICASIGYVYLGYLSKQMPGWEVICWILTIALPLTFFASWVLMPSNFAFVSPKAWISFCYVALFSMFIGFFAWNSGLAIGGVARVSQVQLLQTFVTLGLSVTINGEVLDPVTLFAAILVVGIVAFGRSASVVYRAPMGVE